MSKPSKTKTQSKPKNTPKPQSRPKPPPTSQPTQPTSITAVVVPVDVFSNIRKVLAGLPYSEVGDLMGILENCQPQELLMAKGPN